MGRIFGLNLRLIALAYIWLIVLMEIPVCVKILAEERFIIGDLRVIIRARMEISVFGDILIVVLTVELWKRGWGVRLRGQTRCGVVADHSVKGVWLAWHCAKLLKGTSVPGAHSRPGPTQRRVRLAEFRPALLLSLTWFDRALLDWLACRRCFVVTLRPCWADWSRPKTSCSSWHCLVAWLAQTTPKAGCKQILWRANQVYTHSRNSQPVLLKKGAFPPSEAHRGSHHTHPKISQSEVNRWKWDSHDRCLNHWNLPFVHTWGLNTMPPNCIQGLPEEKEWELYKSDIRRMYLVQRKTLKELAEEMSHRGHKVTWVVLPLALFSSRPTALLQEIPDGDETQEMEVPSLYQARRLEVYPPANRETERCGKIEPSNALRGGSGACQGR